MKRQKVKYFLGPNENGCGSGANHTEPTEEIQALLDTNPEIIALTQAVGPTGWIHTTIIYREAE
jgi:hypothetical protein